ncbi:DNA-binding MarR family transcriptional regulator [Filibacter limicola]|uniref:DNA-binding MarR family transcriptional regulator n=2 Tax=Sporosarcina limicola TaxID=34101 RepID=A0A927MJV4_9BACL|nr:DNA-binding MarR family transcriptional regulator [Sporosarcina limicola]
MTEHSSSNHQYTEEVAHMEKELRYISGIIKQQGRRILSNYTITPPQFVALQWLFEHGDMTIGDLSNKMYLAFSTTTDLVDRMENNNLVKRVRDEQDRRVVRIHLLSEGERIIEEVIDKRRVYLNTVLADFDEQQVENFSNLLTKLHHEMKKD